MLLYVKAVTKFTENIYRQVLRFSVNSCIVWCNCQWKYVEKVMSSTIALSLICKRTQVAFAIALVVSVFQVEPSDQQVN